MPVPQAVQRQIDEANAILAQIHGAAAVEATKPPSPDNPPIVTAPVTTGEVAPSPQPSPQPSPELSPAPTEDPFEQKYKVLQGKYTKEVPRLSQELAYLKAVLAQQEEQIANMRAAPTATGTLVTPEEVEQYGPELVDLVGRRAQEVAAPIVSQLRDELQVLRRQMEGVTSNIIQNDRDKVIDALAASVDNYLEINTSPEFKEWLDQIDPFAGESRGVLLRRAYEANDADRVVRFFTSFLQENAAMRAAPTQGSQPGTPRVNLAAHTAPGLPGRGTSMASGAQNEKRIWSSKLIADFYADVNRGHFRNREADKRAIESDIIAAAREGRVVS